MKVRRKLGSSPVLFGTFAVPEHPEYIEVPEQHQDGAALLCQPGGPLERAPHAERGPDGTFAPTDPAARPPPSYVNPRRGPGRPPKAPR